MWLNKNGFIVKVDFPIKLEQKQPEWVEEEHGRRLKLLHIQAKVTQLYSISDVPS